MNHMNKAFFHGEIMFTSKFKNTHPHLEEMPSRFPCDLSGHICGQYCLACGQLSFYCFISASVCLQEQWQWTRGRSCTHAQIGDLGRYAHPVYTQKDAYYGCIRTSVHTFICSVRAAMYTTNTHTGWSKHI